MRSITDLAYIAMVAFAAAGAAEIVWLRLHSSARRVRRWRSLLDDLEPNGLSSVPLLDAPVIGDAHDQGQPAAPFGMNARPARRHRRIVVVANLHPDARRELSDLEANVGVGMEHRVGDELVGEQNRDLDQLNAIP
jgi:hypothetical protein